MDINKLLTTTFLYCLLFLPFNLAAHSFDIAVIAPFSSENANEGIDFWNGMRVATRERDGHDNETSDGHLGGVDSQLLKFDTMADRNTLLKEMSNIGSKQGFIIAVISKNTSEFLSLIPENIPYIVIINDVFPEESNSNVLSPVMVGGKVKETFHKNFIIQYNQSPSESATAGYTAARLIDAAIRQTDGDFTHSKEVQKAFMEAIHLIKEID